MNTIIYDKTAKGREEIATRVYRLAPRLRTLLVMVDGKHAMGALLQQVAGLGLTETAATDLLEEGFIVAAPVAAAPVVSAPAPLPEAASPPPSFAPMAPRADTALHAPVGAAAEQFQALYVFYNQTIKANLGLRGLPLQLKVERAASVDDLRALRRAFLEATQKARGTAVAVALRAQLDAHLGGAPEFDFSLEDHQ